MWSMWFRFALSCSLALPLLIGAALGVGRTIFGRADVLAMVAVFPRSFASFQPPFWNADIVLFDIERRLMATIIDLPTTSVASPTLSSDGRLAFVTERFRGVPENLYVWDHGNLIDITQSRFDHILEWVWSPDGRLSFTASSAEERGLYIWNSQTPNELTNLNERGRYPTWSDEGKLAYAVWGGIDLNTQIYLLDSVFTHASIIQVEWSRSIPIWLDDGRLVFMNDYRSNGLEYAVLASDGTRSFINTEYGVDDPVWSSDGRYALWRPDPNNTTGSARDDIWVWDGTQLIKIPMPQYESRYFMWLSNGLLAIVANGDIFIWDGQTLRNVTNTPGYEADPAWMP
jgi:WD40 repeat protein